MPEDELYQLIEHVLTDHPEDIDCEDCAAVVDAIARYVDLEVAGHRPGLALPSIPIHLELCSHCAEMYEALFQIAQLDAQGALPDIAALQAEIQVILAPGPSTR